MDELNSSLNTIVVSEGGESFLNTDTLADPSSTPTPELVPTGWYPSSVIVLLSDGENNQNPDPLLISDFAADLGVRIYTIGLGSLEGAPLEIEGFTVISRLDPAMLQAISDTTGGQFYFAANEDDLVRIYSDLEPRLSIKPEDIEITSLFAGAGMFLFLVAGALSLLWFGRVP